MQVSINELRTLIPTIGVELTPIIQSEAGCGKTSLLGMMEQDLGDKYDYVYVDCPVKDMSDIAMTIPNHATKSLENYNGSIFKLESPKPKIILLDEFMKAPKMLQVIFTRLMLERCIGDTPLPEGSIVFGTSNNETDGLGDTMLAHAGNRVCLLQMEKPNAKTWIQWATDNGIHSLVRAWVHMFPTCLASYKDGNEDDNPYIFQPKKHQLSFCSPRSLAKSSVIISAKDKMTPNALMCALAGTIGKSAASQFSAFLSLEKVLPDWKDIFDNPQTTDVPEDTNAQLMLIFQALDRIENAEDCRNVLAYVTRFPSREMHAIFFTQVLKAKKTKKIASGVKEITKWAEENSDLF
tara:strand:+ start:567 stop:1619 length:1053 start_codon:yes stop_codon:yes gene_type:complete